MTPRDYLTTRLADLAEVRKTWALDDELLIGSQAEIASLSATVEAMAGALIAVLDKHKPVEEDTLHWDCVYGRCEHVGDCPTEKQTTCAECSGLALGDGADLCNLPVYPCPTVQAITTATIGAATTA